jgi:hypothetical protein
MAGPDVIRDAGDTLVQLLQAGISAAMVNPNRIFLATPDEFTGLEDPPQPTITVFLYRVALHATSRNTPRRVLPDGRILPQPLPLELNYLITPWARETRAEHLMAGRVLQVLYGYGEVGPADLVGASWEPTDSVQVVFDSLPLDDHYRIWDANHDVSYRLSLAYTLQVVNLAATKIYAEPPVVDARFSIART